MLNDIGKGNTTSKTADSGKRVQASVSTDSGNGDQASGNECSKSVEGVDGGGNESSVLADSRKGDEGNKKSVSFAEAVQGLKANGDNKLKFIHVSVNELGKSFVDLDHVIEEGSKLWNRTLVGYFVGM